MATTWLFFAGGIVFPELLPELKEEFAGKPICFGWSTAFNSPSCHSWHFP